MLPRTQTAEEFFEPYKSLLGDAPMKIYPNPVRDELIEKHQLPLDPNPSGKTYKIQGILNSGAWTTAGSYDLHAKYCKATKE